MSDNIVSWVRSALKNENIEDVKVHGGKSSNQGYLGRVTFVSAITKCKTFELVIKTPIDCAQLPVEDYSNKEVLIYHQVIPAFSILARSVGESLLDVVPRAFKTEDAGSVLILENLKPKGYDVWDRQMAMSLLQMKLVLQVYGKFHALSFALRHKNKSKFTEITKDNVNMFLHVINFSGFLEFLEELFNDALNNCDTGDAEGSKVLEDLGKNVKEIMSNQFFDSTDEQVVLHSDCWTPNYLFKTDSLTNQPTDVRIIDWQLSSLGSPILDVSLFLYCCCDTSIHKEVGDFLTIYYQSFSETLEKFELDSKKIFPYDSLLRHWKKFSCYGLAHSNFLLKLSLCNADEIPNLSKVAGNMKYADVFRFKTRTQNEYYRRVGANLKHYVHNLQ